MRWGTQFTFALVTQKPLLIPLAIPNGSATGMAQRFLHLTSGVGLRTVAWRALPKYWDLPWSYP